MSDSTYVSKPTIGWRFRALRAQHRKTSTEMAALLSFTSETQYLDAESGSCIPLERYATLIGRLAVRYGVPVRTLLEDDASASSPAPPVGAAETSLHSEALSAFAQMMGKPTPSSIPGAGGAATVGKRLKKLRLERELSIVDVCEAINVDELLLGENRRLMAKLRADGAAGGQHSSLTLQDDTDSLQPEVVVSGAGVGEELEVAHPESRRVSAAHDGTAGRKGSLLAAQGPTSRRRSSATSTAAATAATTASSATANRRRSSAAPSKHSTLSEEDGKPSSTAAKRHSTTPRSRTPSSASVSTATPLPATVSTTTASHFTAAALPPPPLQSHSIDQQPSNNNKISQGVPNTSSQLLFDNQDSQEGGVGLVTERDMERIESGNHMVFERWMTVLRTFCLVARVDPFFLVLGL